MKDYKGLDVLCSVIQERLFSAYGTELFNNALKRLTKPGRYTNSEFHKLRVGANAVFELKEYPAELFWFAEAIEDIDGSIARVSDYFSPSQVAEYKNYVKDRFTAKDLRTLNNVFQMAPNQWACVVSVTNLALMSKFGIIRTDPNLKRTTKAPPTNADSSEIMRKLHVNTKRVAEIEECLLNEEYAYNTIRINLMDDGTCKAPYDDRTHTLTIPDDGDCIVLDGNHRRRACEQLYAHHPELRNYFSNRYFQVAFTFYSPSIVKRVISQEWNQEKISAKHILAMKPNLSNEIVADIIKSEKSDRIFADKITTTGVEKKKGSSLMVYADMSAAIEKNYKANEFGLRTTATEISEWLVEFYNYLSELFFDDFSDVKASMKTKWLTQNYVMTYGFIYASKLLHKNPNWKKVLLRAVNSIDWSLAGSPIDPSKSLANIKKIECCFKEAMLNANV